MVNRQCQSLIQLGFPLLDGLVLPCIDQIETDTFKTVAGYVKRCHCFSHGMYPTQSLKVTVVQGLNSHRNPIDASIPKSLKLPRFNGSRIGLQCDFGIIGHGPEAPNMVQNGRDRVRVHQAGRAAAKEHCA